MARRKTEVFSMSFLDCITCAFGSVVLVYVLISAQGGLRHIAETRAAHAEVSKLEEQVLEGYQELVVLRNSMQQTDAERVRTEGMAPRVIDEIAKTREELADSDKETLSKRDAIERLKADLKALDEGQRRLEGGTRSPGPRGMSLRGFEGEGARHYLTGLKIQGQRVLFLVDDSASMLDETLVNILRMRNMSDNRKRLAEKWQRTVSITEWLTAHVPEAGKFQIYAFNTKPWPLLKGTEGKWLEGNDAEALNGTMTALHDLVPHDGTSLYWATDKKISLHVFGDEFTGPSIDSVVKAVDFVNRTDESGERRVRIHAVGFPVTPQAPQYTSIRFAALMRIICQKNGGTFVGMHEAESRAPRLTRTLQPSPASARHV